MKKKDRYTNKVCALWMCNCTSLSSFVHWTSTAVFPLTWKFTVFRQYDVRNISVLWNVNKISISRFLNSKPDISHLTHEFASTSKSSVMKWFRNNVINCNSTISTELRGFRPSFFSLSFIRQNISGNCVNHLETWPCTVMKTCPPFCYCEHFLRPSCC